MQHYEVGELLGRGGMGEVYRGRHPGLDQLVAIKFLRSELGEQPEFYERFLREARLCAHLDHPAIVRVSDVGSDGGRPYLVMELVEGESLQARLRRGPLPQAETVQVASQVLAALAYAHAQGVVHRDIKPGNIFLCRAGGVKVMDFGIARIAGAVALTQTGAQLGTPEYMSPEQVEGRTAEASSDLYAMGVVLYEMLTGDVPFRAETPVVVLRMHLDKAPPALPGWVWPGLAAVVARALAKGPEERYPSAAAMRDALEEASGAELPPQPRAHLDGKAPGQPAAAEQPAATGPRRGAALGIAGAVLALVVGLALFHQPTHPRANPVPAPPLPEAPSAPSTPAAPSSVSPERIAPPGSPQATRSPPVDSTAPLRILEPQTAEGWNQQGWALYNHSRWAEAEKAFLQATRLNPHEALYWARVGNARRNQGNWPEAEAAYAEAVRWAPDKAVYHSNLAWALYKQEKWSEAEQEYRRAIARKPGEAAYHNRLANTLKRQGRTREAGLEYVRAVELDPKPAVYWDNLGDMCGQVSRWEDAVTAYAQAVAREPAQSEYGQRLARKLAAAREGRAVE
jgi:serine/threonine protein kinase